jgi:hypothetical protein
LSQHAVRAAGGGDVAVEPQVYEAVTVRGYRPALTPSGTRTVHAVVSDPSVVSHRLRAEVDAVTVHPAGALTAVDEYLAEQELTVLMHRLDYSGRLIIKP